ncbi:Nif3-like dinuclear metal center hexameric protein [Geobacter sp. DSM 9736]|uniref:Nif3-like dinuclear metal center hexameric protein n=1 Tax=Geobacter sp. DSM 9736 TaxID=1277350 RepID=UPI000B50A626|nr:Nif3-like dinuclear metal center hexameric protein [Geobacter sp. DSM 9736]SNB47804.1 dinuclear metal center protein, YbgI/SA1388 family [Geobacter sp. DSM 9736]
MSVPKVSDILGIIDKLAPFYLSEGWDNAGLQLGDPAAEAGKIMVSLDPGADAINAAIAGHCNLLLTHHPLFFSPIKKLSTADTLGRIAINALKNDLSVISLHTNYDIAEGGLNDLLAQRLGVHDVEPLKSTGAEELAKLAVFVPRGHEERVLESLFRFSGFIGNYSECSFRVEGAGTFKPLSGARPFIGEVGMREEVDEVRVEVLLRKQDLASAIKSLKSVHPYEEPALDVYPLLNQGKARGLGRVGKLLQPMTLDAFAARVKELLCLDGLRLVGDTGRPVRKVALCGGSGMSVLRAARFCGADVLVTGDIKYHEAREAEALGIALIDAGHFGTERIMVQGVAEKLVDELTRKKLEADILPFTGEREPFTYR